MKYNSILFIVLINALIFGCSGGIIEKSVFDSAPSVMSSSSSDAATLKLLASQNWQNRLDKVAVEKAISLWEQAEAADAGDYEIPLEISHAYYWLADAFYPIEDKEAKQMYHNKGYEAAKRAMYHHPAYKAMVDGGSDVEQAVAVLPLEYVGAIFWGGANLSEASLAGGFSAKLMNKGRIKSMYEAALKLNPDYYYSAPYRTLAGYYAVAPTTFGGDINKAKEYFDIAINKSPMYLANKTLMAEFYCPRLAQEGKLDDASKLFDELLNQVIAAPIDADAQIVPENTIEQQKAKKMLSLKEMYFE
jgi:hypothetical protein